MRRFKRWLEDYWEWLIVGLLSAAFIVFIIVMVINAGSLSDAVAEDLGGFIKKVKEASE